MQLPEGIPTRTVTGLYLTLDGSPATGDVHFYAPGPLLDSENNVILANRTFVACLDYDGRVTVELPTTDNPNFLPTGWAYTVTEYLCGAKGRSFELFLTEGSEPVDLADVAPVEAPEWSGF